MDEMVAEGLAKARVSRMLTRVRAVFALAMKTKVVSIAPPPTSSPGERPAANRDALTLAEAKATREKIRGDRYEAVPIARPRRASALRGSRPPVVRH